jgi:polyhydroxyalkanoate synthesis repressor PhaR
LATHLIKRYSNRKLYDTTTKTYVTLEAIGAMISRGEEIQVLDNDTNEDLTSVVLSQLLLERERSQRFLPSAILSQLWRAGKEASSFGQTLAELTRPLVPEAIRQFWEYDVERSFKVWLELAEDGEDELLRLLESLIERRRQNRHLSNSNNNMGETGTNTTRERLPVNPIEAVGVGLAKRLGLRRSLDNFEDWNDPPAPPKTPSVEVNQNLNQNIEANLAQTSKLITQTLSHLAELDPTLLETLKPVLIQLQQALQNLFPVD